jgi:hypothetical protein
MSQAGTWARSAVFALDQWPRRRQGVHEYSEDPRCLFRIQCVRSDASLALSDGTRVHAGCRVLALHLWNEHIPPMGRKGPDLAWARRIERAVPVSLRALAHYLARHPDLADIVAIYGDMRLGGDRQSGQLLRIAARYGFETCGGSPADRRGLWHRIGDTTLVFMLASATNAVALRNPRCGWGARGSGCRARLSIGIGLPPVAAMRTFPLQ